MMDVNFSFYDGGSDNTFLITGSLPIDNPILSYEVTVVQIANTVYG